METFVSEAKDKNLFESRSYFSEFCGKDKPVNVLLPPGYSVNEKYPVLYFLHGYFMDQNGLTANCRNLFDLMKSGKAQKMIVVFPFNYSSKTKMQCTDFASPEDWKAYDDFVFELIQDLMPWVSKNFSVLEGRDNTAVAGFSMGGREALAIALKHPDKFAYVCAMAPAPGLVKNELGHPGQFVEDDMKFSGVNKSGMKPKIVTLCVGDRDCVVNNYPESYHEIFVKNGVEHDWYIEPESDHGDPCVSNGIVKFIQRIFK